VDAGTAFVCGPNGCVEATTGLLLAGFEPDWIHTERFGPAG
jgi:ferredoxin-NADP reductase